MTVSYWKERALKAEKELKEARVDAAFDIYSRYGIEQKVKGWKGGNVHILFADLDNIHRLNERYGYRVIDRKIRTAFQNIKQKLGKNEFLARWYSGDEWVLISRDNPDRHIHDIFEQFKAQNIGLTLAGKKSRAFSGKLGDLVYPASQRVQLAKRINFRNRYWGCA